MHSSIMIFAYFIYFKSLSALSLQLCLDLSLVIVKPSLVFNLQAAKKSLFLLRWLQGLLSESFFYNLYKLRNSRNFKKKEMVQDKFK